MSKEEAALNQLYSEVEAKLSRADWQQLFVTLGELSEDELRDLQLEADAWVNGYLRGATSQPIASWR